MLAMVTALIASPPEPFAALARQIAQIAKADQVSRQRSGHGGGAVTLAGDEAVAEILNRVERFARGQRRDRGVLRRRDCDAPLAGQRDETAGEVEIASGDGRVDLAGQPFRRQSLVEAPL
jgi:hypothetical protein